MTIRLDMTLLIKHERRVVRIFLEYEYIEEILEKEVEYIENVRISHP